MMIPSIDLQGQRVVQLIGGKKLAVEIKEDPVRFADRFKKYPEVQVIDLDAAKSEGNNLRIIERIAKKLNCRAGGGIRSIEAAERLIQAGVRKVIIGTRAEPVFLSELEKKIGKDAIIVALDSFKGKVTVEGWKKTTKIDPVAKARELEPFCSEFLVTVVDREGQMKGTDIEFIRKIRAATKNRIVAAGGISSMEEIAELEKIGVDSVVGMALYTGKIKGLV